MRKLIKILGILSLVLMVITMLAPTPAMAADTTPPVVNGAFTPTDNATGVSISTHLIITFNEPVKAGTGSFYVCRPTGSNPDHSDDSIVQTINVTDTSHVAFSGNTCTVTLSSNLSYSTDYYINVTAPNYPSPGVPGAISDMSYNYWAGIWYHDRTTWNFTTGAADTTPPTVNTFSPADNSPSIAINTNLVITFSENVTKGTGNIVIKKSSDNSIVQTIAVTSGQVTISGAQVTINPTSDLAYGTDYYVNINAGAITDTAPAHNAYAGIADTTTWNFKTIQFDLAAPTVSFFSPVDNSAGVAIGTNLVITFDENVASGTGYIYIMSGATIVYSIEVNAGISSGEVTIAGNVVTINPPSDLSYFTDYYIMIDSGALRDTATPAPNAYAGIADTTT